MVKAPNQKLGLSIRGGGKGSKGNPLDPNDEGIFISKVREGGREGEEEREGEREGRRGEGEREERRGGEGRVEEGSE